MRLVKYNFEHHKIWNRFNSEAKNGLFIFDRKYMEYHSERFNDHSLLFYDGDALVALMPACQKETAMHSHLGLTFGGLILSKNIKQKQVLEIFETLVLYCQEMKIDKIYYKPVPQVYSLYPSEEDLYALFINNASVVSRNTSTMIYMPNRLSYSKGRKWSVKKSKNNSLRIDNNLDFHNFFELEKDLISRKYDSIPTHNAEEMKGLATSFSNNIKLYSCYTHDDALIGGVIIYLYNNLAHCQYIGSNDMGYELGAVDFLIDNLIDTYQPFVNYFDFGTSNSNNGLYLESSLIQFKESFGGRTICYDTYKLDL